MKVSMSQAYFTGHTSKETRAGLTFLCEYANPQKNSLSPQGGLSRVAYVISVFTIIEEFLEIAHTPDCFIIIF